MRKLYYKLTKYLPRPLPRTDEEFKNLKHILTQYYGLEDHPKYWYTVASQLMAGSPTSLHRSYGHIVNAAKKLEVAAVVQNERELATRELKDRLETQMKEMQDAFKAQEEQQADETPDLNGDSREIVPQWADVPGQPHPTVQSGP